MLFNPFIGKKNSATFFFSHGMNGSWGKKMNEFLPLKDARRWMAVEERRGGRSVNEVSSLLVMDWGLLSLLLFLSSILVCHDWAIKQLDPISNGKRQQFCSFFISSPLSRAQVSPPGGTCRSNWNPKTTPRVGIWGRAVSCSFTTDFLTDDRSTVHPPPPVDQSLQRCHKTSAGPKTE